MKTDSGKCKIAMIGAGNMAREHLKAFSALPNAELAGIYSRGRGKAEKLAEAFNIPLFCDSLDELYNKARPDLIVITVNAKAIAPVVKECLKFPAIILAEKPIGLSVQESAAIMEEADKLGRKVFAGLNRRFYQSTARLLEELESAEGTRFIEIFDQQSPNDWIASGRDRLEGQRMMFANSIHLIDFMTMLGRGRVINIDYISPYNGKYDGEGIIAAAVKFESGDTALYRCFWNKPGPWAVAVSAGGARWEMRPLEEITRQCLGSRKIEKLELGDVDKRFKPGLFLQAKEAVKAALNLAHKLTPIDEAHKTMGLITRIYEI